MTDTAFNPLAEPDQFIAVPRWSFSRMNRDQQAVYNTLLEQVDFETGIWNGTAYRIADATGLHLRVAQETLKWMHDEKYVKSFHRDGERRAYNIAIHGYQVRAKDSKWLGHRLNALATTEDESTRELHPVYVPTASLTANTTANKKSGKTRNPKNEKELKDNPPRTEPRTGSSDRESDREPTASGTASTTASGTASTTASGTASTTANPPRVPDSRNQEYQDGQEQQDRSDDQDAQESSTTAQEERDEFFDDVAVGGGAPASSESARPPAGSESFDPKQFIADVTEAIAAYHQGADAKQAHRDAAVQLAKEHGADVFLAALRFWLKEVASSQESSILARRTWLLHYFVETIALSAIKRVGRYVRLGARDGVLEFLVHNLEPTDEVTQERVSALGSCDSGLLRDEAFKQAGFDWQELMTDFDHYVGLAKQHYAELRAARARAN